MFEQPLFWQWVNPSGYFLLKEQILDILNLSPLIHDFSFVMFYDKHHFESLREFLILQFFVFLFV